MSKEMLCHVFKVNKNQNFFYFLPDELCGGGEKRLDGILVMKSGERCLPQQHMAGVD